MRLGISALLFNLDKALELCREVDRINHIEVGIDNLDECIKLSKYKGEFDKLNLSLGIHLPMELNSCENIKYIRKSWIDFINKIEILFRVFCKKRNKAPFFLINCRSVKMLIYSITTSASTSAATSSTSSLKFSIINC